MAQLKTQTSTTVCTYNQMDILLQKEQCVPITCVSTMGYVWFKMVILNVSVRMDTQDTTAEVSCIPGIKLPESIKRRLRIERLWVLASMVAIWAGLI